MLETELCTVLDCAALLMYGIASSANFQKQDLAQLEIESVAADQLDMCLIMVRLVRWVLLLIVAPLWCSGIVSDYE